MKAIVIDDSRAMRMILSRMLKHRGYKEIHQATNGLEALGVLHRNRDILLALVDWNMPEMDGLTFVTSIRAQPAFQQLKLVMVTSEVEMTQMQRALEAGADEYVMKPFTEDALMQKLDMVDQ